jgi:late competence protein required for DNA uptake (superfamily II DNA/RNA helicase)
MKRSTADILFSKYIRKRANYTCQRCGAVHEENSQGLHCAHVFTRGGYLLRHDERNALCLCYGCHQWFDSKATKEQKQELYEEWYGSSQWCEITGLCKKSIKDFKLSKDDVEQQARLKYKALLRV